MRNAAIGGFADCHRFLQLIRRLLDSAAVVKHGPASRPESACRIGAERVLPHWNFSSELGELAASGLVEAFGDRCISLDLQRY